MLTLNQTICCGIFAGPGGDMQWCFSQVKGAIDDDVAEGMKSARNNFFFFIIQSTHGSVV